MGTLLFPNKKGDAFRTYPLGSLLLHKQQAEGAGAAVDRDGRRSLFEIDLIEMHGVLDLLTDPVCLAL